jgi:hypothetical protein
MADDNQARFQWKDPKQGGIAATIILIASILTSGGATLVVDKHIDDYVSKDDLARERQSILEVEDGRHQQLTIELRERIDDRIRAEVSTVRSELQRNRERLDKLLEQTAKMSALVEQHFSVAKR